MDAKKSQMGIRQAIMNLERAFGILSTNAWGDNSEAAEKVCDLLEEFKERWFLFHEHHLEEIEKALPDPIENMGGTLPAAVASLAKLLEASRLEAKEYRDALDIHEEKANADSAKGASSEMPTPYLYAMGIGHEENLGPISAVRVPGGWVFQNAIGGAAFVPWNKTTKAVEMRIVLEALAIWRGVGQDANTLFENIGTMFQRDTGFLRPGKSEPAESYYEGREEERQHYWKDWCKKMNFDLDKQIESALDMGEI